MDNNNKFFSELNGFVKSLFEPKSKAINNSERLQIKGVFYLEKICAKTGEILEIYTDNNLVVNGGRTAVTNLLGAGSATKQLTKISFGTNGTAPVGTDTAITGAFTKSLGAVTYPTISSVSFAWTLGAAEGNGLGIREVGILCTDNTLFARKTRALIDKNSDIILNGSWTISF